MTSTLSRDQVEVKLVRWPAESETRLRYAEEGTLRILIVEGGAPAPLCRDVREDWARAPISRDDLHARMDALRAKAYSIEVPEVDPKGMLKYGDRVVPLSPVETSLLEILIAGFRSLVHRKELLDCLTKRQASNSRNALDLHIMRIRRRIRPLGLAVQTARGNGYILEPEFPRNQAGGPNVG